VIRDALKTYRLMRFASSVAIDCADRETSLTNVHTGGRELANSLSALIAPMAQSLRHYRYSTGRECLRAQPQRVTVPLIRAQQ
jgi:hypothetical protein